MAKAKPKKKRRVTEPERPVIKHLFIDEHIEDYNRRHPQKNPKQVLNARRLAEKAEISESFLSTLNTGSRGASRETLEALAQGLDLPSVGHLFFPPKGTPADLEFAALPEEKQRQALQLLAIIDTQKTE